MSFLSQDSVGNMYYRPTPEDEPGIYALRILVNKALYSSVVPQNNLDFLAEITLDQGGPVQTGNDPACNDATIDLNGAFI